MSRSVKLDHLIAFETASRTAGGRATQNQTSVKPLYPHALTADRQMATTITSLLNSLQSHLQSQTQLLPTLHNQLGLPPTALADELSILQKHLTECVEGQIEVRRKQVDEWMCRCDEVESRCIRYGMALGGHAKATGSSVGEIRKEQVLPRRFELISEFHEKLRLVGESEAELTVANELEVR